MGVVFNPFTGTFDFTGSGGGGGGTIGGSIASNQVAVGSGVNAIGGYDDFRYDSALGGAGLGTAPSDRIKLNVLKAGELWAGYFTTSFTGVGTGAESPSALQVDLYVNPSSGNVDQAIPFGFYPEIDSGNVNRVYGSYGYGAQNVGAGVVDTSYTYYAFPSSGDVTTSVAFYAKQAAGHATNDYSFWSDEQGVFRIKADNTFDSVYQAIPALYNPLFTKYTPGAVNHERIVQQWNGNIAEIGTEAGGTGTLRAVKIIGASLNTPATLTANSVPVVTTTGSQALSNKTGNISQWTNDASYTTLAAVAGVGYLTSVTAHNLLSATHGDTLTASVVRGDVLIGNATPKWARLAIGTVGKILQSDGTDVSWATPTGTGVPVLATSPTLTTPVLGVATGTSLALTEAVGASALVLTGATQTASFPVISATQTWNNSGVTFTGWKLDVTNTASATASLLLDLQVGSASVLSVNKSGQLLTAVNGSASSVAIGRAANTGLSFAGGNTVAIAANGTNILSMTSSAANFVSGSSVGWNADTFMFRDAANVIAQRNSTTAQIFRVYNTFTTLNTAVEYFKFDWATTANQFRMGAVKGSSSGTARTATWDYGDALASATAAITVPATSGAIVFGGGITTAGPVLHAANYMELTEMTAPSAGATNNVRIYAEDNGGGKTRLMALFATGAAQQIAIEP